MTLTTCLQCGELSQSPYCAEHKPTEAPKTKTTTQRGYGHRWQQLSKRARRIQPFCSDCGTTENLTTDHSPRAWERYYTGKNIRLIDVDVCCSECNNRRGQARPGDKGTDHASPDPGAKANSLLLSASTDSKEEE